MSEMTNLIKALRCLASQEEDGDCYMERYNSVHMSDDVPQIYCGSEPPEGMIECPYRQNEYGVCFDDGECDWLGSVADILEQYQWKSPDDLPPDGELIQVMVIHNHNNGLDGWYAVRDSEYIVAEKRFTKIGNLCKVIGWRHYEKRIEHEVTE